MECSRLRHCYFVVYCHHYYLGCTHHEPTGNFGQQDLLETLVSRTYWKPWSAGTYWKPWSAGTYWKPWSAQAPTGNLGQQASIGNLDQQAPTGNLGQQAPTGNLGQQAPTGNLSLPIHIPSTLARDTNDSSCRLESSIEEEIRKIRGILKK